jgi:hypothetical protein
MKTKVEHELVDSDPLASKFIEQCVAQRLHIWHDNENGEFAPYQQISIEAAKTLYTSREHPHNFCVIEINEARITPYLDKFTGAFSFGGAYWPVSIAMIIVPKKVRDAATKYISGFNLKNYEDLIWYLLARMQIFYSQKHAFGEINGKIYTSAVGKGKEELEALKLLLDYFLESEADQKSKPLVITISRAGISKKVTSQLSIMMMAEKIASRFLIENQKPNPNWRNKLEHFELSHAIKDDFEHIHRNFAVALCNFLYQEKIIKSKKINSEYLNPTVEFFKITEYPFLNDGDELTSKHFKSVLKTIGYTKPF